MTKKILYLVPHLENKGPTVQLLYLIKYLNRKEFDPVIVTLFKEKEDTIDYKFKKLNIRVISLNGKRSSIVNLRKKLQSVIIKEDPAIIHSNSVVTDIVYSPLVSNVSVVTTQHNYIYSDLLAAYGKLLGLLLCFFERKFLKKNITIVSCSKTVQNKYKGVGIKTKCIQNGIEINQWENNLISKEKLREKLGLPSNAHIFLSTGLLIKRKNPLLIIKAFNSAHIKNSYLVMLGDGSESSVCKKEARDNPHIMFTGKVSNVKSYLYASDTFISVSNAEGLPYSVLEAECTGIKMILSDIPEHREATNSSDLISFTPVSDKKALTDKMITSAKNKKSFHYNMQNFTAKTMSTKYQEIYSGM